MNPLHSPFRIVCLGGSAGALPAYQAILRAVPADSGMAFIVRTSPSRIRTRRPAQFLAEAVPLTRNRSAGCSIPDWMSDVHTEYSAASTGSDGRMEDGL